MGEGLGDVIFLMCIIHVGTLFDAIRGRMIEATAYVSRLSLLLTMRSFHIVDGMSCLALLCTRKREEEG